MPKDSIKSLKAKIKELESNIKQLENESSPVQPGDHIRFLSIQWPVVESGTKSVVIKLEKDRFLHLDNCDRDYLWEKVEDHD